MSSRAQNDIILYALLGRKITPAPSHKKTVSSRRERNKEYAKVRNRVYNESRIFDKTIRIREISLMSTIILALAV